MTLITELMNLLLIGKGGDRNIWLASRLVLIKKPTGGIRPIAIQDSWIRFFLSYVAIRIKEKAKPKFVPHQLGNGAPGGAEIIIHSLNSVVEEILANPDTSDKVIVKLDVKMHKIQCIDLQYMTNCLNLSLIWLLGFIMLIARVHQYTHQILNIYSIAKWESNKEIH
jgi:hypothetical protein